MINLNTLRHTVLNQNTNKNKMEKAFYFCLMAYQPL